MPNADYRKYYDKHIMKYFFRGKSFEEKFKKFRTAHMIIFSFVLVVDLCTIIYLFLKRSLIIKIYQAIARK